MMNHRIKLVSCLILTLIVVITAFLVVSLFCVLPSPQDLASSQDYQQFSQQLNIKQSDTCNQINIMGYSRNELLALRSSHLQPPVEVTSFIHELGITRVHPWIPHPTTRGCRAGRNKRRHIKPKITFRSQENFKCQERTVNSNNLTQIPCLSSNNPGRLLNFCLFNAQSVCNKTDDIIDYVLDNDIDICCITETWLNRDDSVTVAALQINGYKFHQEPRKDRRGGGLGFLVKENIAFQVLPLPPDITMFECLNAKLTIENKIFTIVLVYRPQVIAGASTQCNLFFDQFSQVLSSQIDQPGNLLIAGDFNFHWNNTEDDRVQKLADLLESYNLEQHISQPTHKLGNTLDLLITRHSESTVYEQPSVDHFISDHAVIKCKLSFKKPPPVKSKITFRKLKSIDLTEFQSDIEKESLSENTSTNVSDLVCQYNDTLHKILDKHAPVCTKVVRLREARPWYSEEIAHEKAIRRTKEKKWVNSKSEQDHNEYKCQKNLVTSMLSSGKVDSITKLNAIVDAGSDQKALLKIEKRLLGQTKQSVLPHHDCKQTLANSFSKFFIGKIEKIQSDIFSVIGDVKLEELVDHGRFGFDNFKVLNDTDIRQLISKSATKSCSLDPIPTSMVKSCLPVLSTPILNIVNLSLQTGEFPDSMKQAIVFPLHKKPSLDLSLKNFRPVSNLSYISKLTEKAVAAQLIDYLDRNNLREKFQSSYRACHSTETALMRVKNDIMRDMDNKNVVLLVLLDLSAAFDTVHHGILLRRLENLGIKSVALAWFRSYLSNRKQTVIIDGVSSDPEFLKCGVPQGSVLGPILFTIYVQPLGDLLRKYDCSIHFYADDTQLYFRIVPNQSCLNRSVDTLQQCCAEIKTWLTENLLKFNEDKTECMLIGSRFQLAKVNISELDIGNSQIQVSEKVRNLGVIFDSNMAMSHQISSVCKSVNYQLYNIGKIRKFLTKDACKLLVNAMVTSRLDCNNSLLAGLPKCEIKRLQLLQNTAARIVSQKSRRDHITPVLYELHWLPVSYRINYKVATTVFKCLNNMAPEYLAELLSQKRVRRSLRSSSTAAVTLEIPLTKSKMGDKAFSVIGPTLWNDLPISIRTHTGLEQFKKDLKTHYFKLAYC